MVELLAPAGNRDAFAAALAAGADAVYVGGKRFGARAYAENFDDDALLGAIDRAHLYHRKLYLTVNTLMKQEELDALPAYIEPLYEAGLDGVIVQDFGAIQVLRHMFPDLSLHASTQMTVTGSGGAGLLKELGIERVVPARELSLAEISRIKEDTHLEIETFIHGAMCYSYSGQCLFSSMLGARSGNRGRCAGPCRLPYKAYKDGKQLNDAGSLYQLSLKDLCSLEILPKLIDTGIDSFKIEGRMKQKEYVSFVTGIYRYYIDAYLREPGNYRVSERDQKELRQLFLRGSIETGYYFMHNGPALVTLEKPGYQSFARESAPVDINLPKIPVSGVFTASAGEPMRLAVTTGDGAKAEAVGEIVSAAKSRAATREDVLKALKKTGNTDFVFETIDVALDGEIFLPNKSLNELRRSAIGALTEHLLAAYRRKAAKPADDRVIKEITYDSRKRGMTPPEKEALRFTVSVQTPRQLAGLSGSGCKKIARIILSFDCFEALCKEDAAKTAAYRRILKESRSGGIEICLSLPAVLRCGGVSALKALDGQIRDMAFDGFVVNNLEAIAYARAHFPKMPLISDHRCYLFQKETLAFFERWGITEHFLSFELHEKEIASLISSAEAQGHTFCMPVYGHIPLMETAGCILKTNGCCEKGSGREVYLVDRQNRKIPVILRCERCENTLYNPVPLSLHKELCRIASLGIAGMHLSFTTEDEKQVGRVLAWFDALLGAGDDETFKKQLCENAPFSQFTKGHLLKGVE